MTANVTIELRRGTAAAWTAANPVLAAGEKGLELDTGREKNGDGVTRWVSLPYVDQSAGLAAETAARVTGDNASAALVTAEATARTAGDATEASARVAADALRAFGLTRTGIKTGNYTAAPNELVPIDTTSGTVAITLPTAPPDKTRVAVKHVLPNPLVNAGSVVCGGSDVINRVGGVTSLSITTANQGWWLQYDAAAGVWMAQDSLALGSLDARYVAKAGDTMAGPLVLSGNATLALQAVPKQQMDAGDATNATAIANETSRAQGVEAGLVHSVTAGTNMSNSGTATNPVLNATLAGIPPVIAALIFGD